MKKIIYFVALLTISKVYSQVGINTSNPQGKFHIDGAKDNPATGTPNVSQAKNDIVVLSNGNVGSGTLTPSTKLDINNDTTNGAIKIVDGNQAQGRILVSDENGVGTWQLPNTIKRVQTGIFEKYGSEGLSVESDGKGGYKYSNVSITLTKGVWVVNMGLTLKSYLAKGKGDWVHFKLSSVKTGVDYTGWKNLGTAQNNTSYAGVVFGSAVYDTSSTGTTVYFDANANNYVNGSNIIEVTADQITLYLMIENKNNATVNYSNLTHYYSSLNAEALNAGKTWVFNTANWENYFYANPL